MGRKQYESVGLMRIPEIFDFTVGRKLLSLLGLDSDPLKGITA
jgi:hypothetical protein